MSRTLQLVFFLFISILFVACSDSDKKSVLKLQGSTMGTQYHIVLVTAKDASIDRDELTKQIDDLLSVVSRQMSTYIPDSEISQFNRFIKNDWFSISSDFAKVVNSAQSVSKQTNGAFDITIAPLIDLWGFGAIEQPAIPTDKKIADALQNTGYKLLEVRLIPPALRKRNPKIRIDLSAIAKGFAVDKISSLLESKGYTDYLVEIGGEIHLQGFNSFGKPWRVGIESPDLNELSAKEALLLSNLSLATSGDYRNYFVSEGVRFSHTINPITGRPVTHNLSSVTVLHESTVMADAYATALMVMGDVKGKIFSKSHKVRTHMIVRGKHDFSIWDNLDKDKIVQESQYCEERSGCIYLE